jgi:hypothetical protein
VIIPFLDPVSFWRESRSSRDDRRTSGRGSSGHFLSLDGRGLKWVQTGYTGYMFAKHMGNR